MSACIRVGVCVHMCVHPRGTSEMNQISRAVQNFLQEGQTVKNQISRAVQNFLQEGQTVTRWDCPLTWGRPPAVPLWPLGPAILAPPPRAPAPSYISCGLYPKFHVLSSSSAHQLPVSGSQPHPQRPAQAWHSGYPGTLFV